MLTLSQVRPPASDSSRLRIPVMALVLACCGSGDDAADVAAACKASTNMGAAVCDCLARKAKAELSADEQAFVVAALKEDDEAATRLCGELTLQSAMKAGLFMTKAGSCATPTPEGGQ